jgi:hypothetical protein
MEFAQGVGISKIVVTEAGSGGGTPPATLYMEDKQDNIVKDKLGADIEVKNKK